MQQPQVFLLEYPAFWCVCGALSAGSAGIFAAQQSTTVALPELRDATAGCTSGFLNALLFFQNACFSFLNTHFLMWQFAKYQCLCCQSCGRVDWVFVDTGREVDWAFDCAAQQSTCAMMVSQCDTICDLSANCRMIFVMSMHLHGEG